MFLEVLISCSSVSLIADIYLRSAMNGVVAGGVVGGPGAGHVLHADTFDLNSFFNPLI